VSGRLLFFTPFEEDQEMKKFLMVVALASLALLADSQWASARRGGCGGGRHGGGGCMMGCGGMGGCGMMMGGCGMGGHGMMMGGCGMGGCGMMGGHGGYAMGGGGCPGGVCSSFGSIGNAAVVQAPSNEATLIVTLPENATLTIDGQETTSTSAQRVFVTPALEDGKEYEYTLKAKVKRDGKVEIATAKVSFRAGETKPVELKFAQGVAAQ
jgi:uncharacterized protein (TIGR03000 family)